MKTHHIAIAASAILMVAGRLIPWRRILNRNLTELERRTWGVAGIGCAVTLAALSDDDASAWDVVGWLWQAIAAAGMTTILLWLVSDVETLKIYGEQKALRDGDQLPPLEHNRS